MQASNKPRPYQGYPYVDPPVHDAPSIDQATASRWANLPRTQVTLPVGRINPVVYVDMPGGQRDAEARNINLPKKDEPRPVVYIDVPETSGSLVSEERVSDEPQASTYSDENKRDPDREPVVYIDLPDDNGSVTQTPLTQSPRTEEPQFVQETIFFDPFENRRIQMNKEERGKETESEDDNCSTVSGQSNRNRMNFRPLPAIRPSTLDLNCAGTSGVVTSQPTFSPTVPPILSKETLIYGQTNEDGFPMSPIPVSEFPEPPPAYAEIDRVNSPVVDTEEPRREEQPRTQVILPRDQTTPVGTPNSDRKYLNCHHCGMRVHTLVVRENGTVTHVTAFMFLLVCILPVVAFIYCTDYLKIRNHYCPNCNKIIGYELPFRNNKIVYVN